MMIQCKGFILLTTFLMITVITILVLSLMQCIYLELNISNQLVKSHVAFYDLEEVGQVLVNKNPDPLCIIHEKNPNSINLFMIQNNGCKIRFRSEHNNALRQSVLNSHYSTRDQSAIQNMSLIGKEGSEDNEYYYLISDLGEDPCLIIMSNEIKHSSHQWLINIANKSLHNYYLQLRISTVGKVRTCDLPKPHRINAGLMSWRIISSI